MIIKIEFMKEKRFKSLTRTLTVTHNIKNIPTKLYYFSFSKNK